jgi:thioester reductase-like protein
LLARKGTIHCLVRKGSLGKFDDLVERLGADKDRLVPIVGDLSKPNLGIAPDKAKALGGKITHVFHLAALYDITADAKAQLAANVEGTHPSSRKRSGPARFIT